eukprot:scaffold40973_cov20-Tisochrysis_lutea.AAC.1
MASTEAPAGFPPRPQEALMDMIIMSTSFPQGWEGFLITSQGVPLCHIPLSQTWNAHNVYIRDVRVFYVCPRTAPLPNPPTTQP